MKCSTPLAQLLLAISALTQTISAFSPNPAQKSPCSRSLAATGGYTQTMWKGSSSSSSSDSQELALFAKASSSEDSPSWPLLATGSDNSSPVQPAKTTRHLLALCMVPLLWGTYGALVRTLYSIPNAPPELLFNLFIATFFCISLLVSLTYTSLPKWSATLKKVASICGQRVNHFVRDVEERPRSGSKQQKAAEKSNSK